MKIDRLIGIVTILLRQPQVTAQDYGGGISLAKGYSVDRSIRTNQLISFVYGTAKGRKPRTVEPYLLIFRWSAWYVYGYCRSREEFRLFKRDFVSYETLREWMRSFGDRVLVLEPPALIEDLVRQAQDMLKKYEAT